jgi:hypothetical protein
MRGHGKTIALTALALGVVLVLFVSLGVMPALEQKAIEAELAAREAAAQAEWAAREEEAKREAWWKTLGDPELVYGSASEVLEIVYGSASEVLEIVQEEEAKRQAESEDDPLAGLAIEEDTAPPRRKTRTKSKSTHRQDKRPMPMGAHPDDPLGDVLPGL